MYDSSKGHIEGNSTLERNVAKLPRPSVPEPSHVPVLEATSSEGETVSPSLIPYAPA